MHKLLGGPQQNVEGVARCERLCRRACLAAVPLGGHVPPEAPGECGMASDESTLSWSRAGTRSNMLTTLSPGRTGCWMNATRCSDMSMPAALLPCAKVRDVTLPWIGQKTWLRLLDEWKWELRKWNGWLDEGWPEDMVATIRICFGFIFPCDATQGSVGMEAMNGKVQGDRADDGFPPDTAEEVNCFQMSDTSAFFSGTILRLLWCAAMCACLHNMMIVAAWEHCAVVALPSPPAAHPSHLLRLDSLNSQLGALSTSPRCAGRSAKAGIGASQIR